MYREIAQQNITSPFAGLADRAPEDTLVHYFVSTFFAMSGNTYEDTMHKIKKLMNDKYGGAWYCGYFGDCYTLSEIEVTINAYDNLVLDKQMQEYNLDKISLHDAKIIESAVSYASGINLERTHNILSGLFYHFKDGIVKEILLYPETSRRNEGYKLVPDELKHTSGLELADDMLDGLLDFTGALFNVVVFAGIAIGGIYVIDRFGLK